MHQPPYQLADQAQADHGDHRARLRLREADRMERDRGRRDERGVSGRDPVRDRHDQIRWHRDDLSVACVALADARDERADRKPRIAARVEHLARAAVPERRVLIEATPNRRERCRDSLASGGI